MLIDLKDLQESSNLTNQTQCFFFTSEGCSHGEGNTKRWEDRERKSDKRKKEERLVVYRHEKEMRADRNLAQES